MIIKFDGVSQPQLAALQQFAAQGVLVLETRQNTGVLTGTKAELNQRIPIKRQIISVVSSKRTKRADTPNGQPSLHSCTVEVSEVFLALIDGAHKEIRVPRSVIIKVLDILGRYPEEAQGPFEHASALARDKKSPQGAAFDGREAVFCPKCKAEGLRFDGEKMVCDSCGHTQS